MLHTWLVRLSRRMYCKTGIFGILFNRISFSLMRWASSKGFHFSVPMSANPKLSMGQHTPTTHKWLRNCAELPERIIPAHGFLNAVSERNFCNGLWFFLRKNISEKSNSKPYSFRAWFPNQEFSHPLGVWWNISGGAKSFSVLCFPVGLLLMVSALSYFLYWYTIS